jgi:hypothetical protein
VIATEPSRESTSARVALDCLADSLIRHGVKVGEGSAPLISIEGIAACLPGRAGEVYVWCHDHAGTLAFCTSNCRRLGAVDQVADVTAYVLRKLRS